MPIKVRISRQQLIQQNIQKIEDRVTETELVRRAQNVISEARALAPVSDGTHSFTDGVPGQTSGGRLRDSLKFGFTTQRGRRVIRIFSDALNARGQQYANIVVKGSRPHVISGAPRLNFQWIKRGVFVVTDQVSHPGTQPNPFLREALKRGFGRR